MTDRYNGVPVVECAPGRDPREAAFEHFYKGAKDIVTGEVGEIEILREAESDGLSIVYKALITGKRFAGKYYCRVVRTPAEPSVVHLAVNHADTDAERAKAFIGRLNAVLSEQLKPIVSELEADGFVADFQHSDEAGIVQCTKLTKTKVFT